jgi:hypothetical protein
MADYRSSDVAINDLVAADAQAITGMQVTWQFTRETIAELRTRELEQRR